MSSQAELSQLLVAERRTGAHFHGAGDADDGGETPPSPPGDNAEAAAAAVDIPSQRPQPVTKTPSGGLDVLADAHSYELAAAASLHNDERALTERLVREKAQLAMQIETLQAVELDLTNRCVR